MREDEFLARGRSAVEVGEAASGIVHDFANIIQAIILRGEFILAKGILAETDSSKMEQLLNDSRIMGEVLHMLLERGRAIVASSPERVELRSIAQKAMKESGIPGISHNFTEDPVEVKGDALLLSGMTDIAFRVLAKDAGPGTAFHVTSFKAAHEEIEALSPPWLEPCPWGAVTITRKGGGGKFPLDEEFHLSHKTPEEIDLDILRIRGVIKLHSGFFRVEKEEETAGGALSFSYYIPDRKP